MAHQRLRGEITVNINVLLMRLFDPDCMYTRFGKLDGTGKAIALWRQIDLLTSAGGLTKAKRLFKRTHHATPLVRAVLLNSGDGSMEEEGMQTPPSSVLGSPAGGSLGSDAPRVADPRTRAMLLQGEKGRGFAVPAGVPRPP